MSTRKQIHVSHASCDHDKTPVARAKCRRLRRGGAPETSKAEIVARVIEGPKNTDSPGTVAYKQRTKASKKSKKRSKDEAAAPVLRKLLSLNAEIDELEPGLSETLDVTYDDTPACEQDDVKVVQVNVIAKGSKVVHEATGSDDAMLFACTKRPINIDTAKITTNDVTCKNCAKITK